MQIVIDIDEEQYKFIKQSMTIDKVKDYHAFLFDICERIANGTPLPKGLDDELLTSVLDKIRAEIGKLDNLNPNYLSSRIIMIDKHKVYEIIEKQKNQRRKLNDCI